MNKRLPFLPIPQSGEAPLSVLRRAALGNGHQSTLRFAFALNPHLDHAPTAMATLARSPLLYRDTCRAMGLSDEQIARVSYQRTGRAREDDLIWNGLRVGIGDLQFRRARLCVQCYLEQGYASNEWDHIASIACSRHQVLLNDACPCCLKPWTHVSDPFACRCDPEEMVRRRNACDHGSAVLLTHLILAGDQIGIRLLSRVKKVIDWWKRLQLPVLAKNGAAALANLYAGRWPRVDAMDITEDAPRLHPRIALAPLLACSVLEHVSHAASLLQLPAPDWRSNRVTGIAWPASTAMAVLQVSRTTFASLLEGGQLAADSQGRVSVSAINELLWTPSTRFQGVPAADKQLPGPSMPRAESHGSGLAGLTIGDASSRLCTNTESIRGLIRVGLLKAVKGAASSTTQWIIDANSMTEFDREYVFASALVPKGKPGRTTIASRLRSAGLSAVSGPGIDGGISFVFRRAEVVRIDLAAIYSVPYCSPAGRKPLNHQVALPETLSQKAAAEMLGIRVADIRVVVANGWLSPVSPMKTRQKFAEQEVYRLREELQHQYRDLVNALATTGQSRAEFQHTWINTGFIVTRRIGSRTLIRVSDLARIAELWQTHGTGAAIGRDLHRRRWLCPNLAKMGCLRPCTILGSGRHKVRLYLRADPTLSRYLTE